jgi:hypothetical protein
MELDTKINYPLITIKMRPPTDWDDLYRETDVALCVLVARLRENSNVCRKFVVDISEIGISMYWTVQFGLSALIYYKNLLPILAEEAVVVCPNMVMR